MQTIRSIIIVFNMLFQLSLGIPGYHTAGIEFVFGCPYVSGGEFTTCTIHLSTESFDVSYDLWEPQYYNKGDYPATQVVRGSLSSGNRISHTLHKECQVTKEGIYQSYRLNSTSPVSIILDLVNAVKNNFAIVKLIPRESCSYQYYISTNKGHVFMLVHAFSQTKVTVRFSETKDQFSKPCWGDETVICKPNAVVTLDLDRYQFWYFMIDEPKVDLHNTIIESDEAVFVVAGNMQTMVISGNEPTASTMKPTVAWGKTYIVPHFFEENLPARVILRINAHNFPFHLRVTHGFTTILFLNSEAKAEYIHNEMTRPVAVTASTAFGLHAIMPTTKSYLGSLRDASLINVIPVEQWMDGFIRFKNSFDDMTFCHFTFLILSTADPKYVVFGNSKRSPKWREVVTLGKTTFHFTTVDMKGSDELVYVKNVPGRLMLYIRTQPGVYGSSAFPYDFYQGVVAREGCTKVEPAASDGVDNDCDGAIDEEANNDKDDDGDGEVDEDFVEGFGIGQWSEWIPHCIIKCGNAETVQYTRECMRPRFSSSCTGKTEICEPNKECLNNCVINLTIECKCNSNCFKCDGGAAVCKTCNPGYLHTTLCQKRCPTGWMGTNCLQGPKASDNPYDLGYTNESLNSTGPPGLLSPKPTATATERSSWMRPFLLLVLCCAIFPFLILMACFKNRQRRSTRSREIQKLEEIEKIEEPNLPEDIVLGETREENLQHTSHPYSYQEKPKKEGEAEEGEFLENMNMEDLLVELRMIEESINKEENANVAK